MANGESDFSKNPYVGKACLKCGVAFTEDDKIIVCDSCKGAMHQQCWDDHGGCATQNCKNSPERRKGSPANGTLYAPNGSKKSEKKKKGLKTMLLIYGCIIAVAAITVGILFVTKVLCIHDWQPATCTRAEYCSKCDRERGEALGHDWEEATCTDPETCARCGETRGEALDNETDASSEKEEETSLIPDDATWLNGNAYYAYTDALSWEDAESYCNDLGGHLISIHSAEEQNLALELAQATGKDNVWTGGYLSANDVWTWTDGSSFSYTNWDISQPDCYDETEFYIRFPSRDINYTETNWIAYEGKWNDTAMEGDSDAPLSSFCFICEWRDGVVDENANVEIDTYEDNESDFGTSEAVSKNVFAVSDTGWFVLNDDSIMDMTKEELEDALDMSLAEPEYFPWWGNDLYSVDITYDGIQICLMFQNGRLVMITHDIMGFSWYDSVWNEAVNQLDYSEKNDGYGWGYNTSWNYYYQAAEDYYAETGELCMKQYYISDNYA